MKKPDEPKPSSNPKRTRAAAPDAGADDVAKKQPAQAGAIKSTDIAASNGKAATTRAADIEQVRSNLVGNKIEGLPAAVSKTSKPAEKPAMAQAATPESPLKLETAKPETPKPEAAKIEGAKVEAAKPEAAKAESAKPESAKPEPTRTESAKPDSAPAPRQPAKAEQSAFWPMVLGGMVAAIIGALATMVALPFLPASWLPERQAAQIDMAAIQSDAANAAEAAVARRIEELRQSEPAPAIPAEELTAMQQQIDELLKRPAFDPALAQRLQSLTAQAEALETQIQTAAQQAQSQITAAQAEALKLQEAAEGSTRRAEAVAAIASLQAALDRGLQPDEARQTMEGAGIETPDALNREIASLGALQSAFPDAARAALRASLREESASGQGNLLTNFLRAQTGARSVEPRDGDDADAILSRANAQVEAGRIGDALTEIDALSEAARTAPSMADWIDQATAYRDAQSALSDLSATSN